MTDSSITIGFGDDAGYAAAQGLDKEMSDAVRAMIRVAAESPDAVIEKLRRDRE